MDQVQFPQTPDQQPEPVRFPQPQDTSPVLSNPDAQSRALKAEYGLRDIHNQPFEYYLKNLQSGNENNTRKEAAAKVDERNASAQSGNIMDAISKGDFATVSQLAKPFPKADPSTVFENAFADNLVRTATDPNDPYNTEVIRNFSPEALHSMRTAGASLAGQRQYIQTTAENLSNLLENQSYAGFLADQAKSMWQPYREFKLRGSTSKVGWFEDLLLGENLQRQAEAINRGWPATKGQFDETVKRLSDTNPSEAMNFVQYVLGQTSDQRALDNFFSILGIVDLAGGIRGIRGFVKGKGGRPLPKKEPAIEGHPPPGPDDPDLNRWENEGGTIVDSVKNLVKDSTLVGAPPTTLEDKVKGPIKQDPEVVARNAVGDDQGAAIVKAAKREINFLKGAVDPEVELIEAMPQVTRVDVDAMNSNPGLMGREFTARLLESRTNVLSAFFKALRDTIKPNSIPEVTWVKEQFEKAAAVLADKYWPNDDGLKNIMGPYRGAITGKWSVAFIHGTPTGKFFESADAAAREAAKKRIGIVKRVQSQAYTAVGGRRIYTAQKAMKTIPGASIKNDGKGWYIEQMVPMNYTDNVVRDARGNTYAQKTLQGFLTRKGKWFRGYMEAAVNWARSPDETSGFAEQFARKTATYSPSAFLKWAEDSMRDVGKLAPGTSVSGLLNQERWKRFQEALEYSQKTRNLSTSKPGSFFKSVGDLEMWYQSTYKDGLPDEQFIKGYFAYRNVIEADYWYRVVKLVQNKSKMGAMSHSIHVQSPDGGLIKSEPFEGILDREPPAGEGPVLYVKRQIDHSRIVTDSLDDLKHRTEMNEEIKTGKAIHIRVYAPELFPLRNFAKKAGLNTEVRYQHVVTRLAETRPLDFQNQLGRTEGGHLQYDHKFKLAWAKMHFDPITKHNWYHGDGTFAVGDHEAELQGFANHINAIHEFMDKGDSEGAKNYLRSLPPNEFPISWEDLSADYRPTKNPINGEISPPRLNPKEKLRVIPMHDSIVDVDRELQTRYGDNFRNGLTAGSPARQAQVQFTGERDVYDLQQVQDRGSRYNPLYNLTPADTISPIPMMTRALKQIAHSMFMDEYKITAVENWLFGDATGDGFGAAKYLDAKSMSEIYHSPYTWFYHPRWKTGKLNEPHILNLQTAAFKIRQFIGEPSVIDNALDGIAERISNSIYSNLGPKAMRVTPTWLLPKLSNGPQFIRGAVYSVKIGWFNTKQFFMHAFTAVNGALISGWDAASKGTLAAAFHAWSQVNSHPNVIAHMDELMSKMGWKPGWFTEALEGIHFNNFLGIDDGRLAIKDNPLSSNVIKGWGEQANDLGMKPFHWGVTPMRAFSWYTAYHRYRVANPIGKIDELGWHQIKEDADILSHNMTRASTSTPQKGFNTFGAMFSSYNLRVLELLTGKRLTRAEKARLFLGYGAILGVPSALGVVGLSTWARQKALEGNYVPGENFWETAFWEGMLPAIINEGTGHLYNIGSVYGFDDLAEVNNLFEGDKSWMETLGGVPAEVAKNLWQNFPPLMTAMSSIVRGDGKFKPKPEHFISMLKDIPESDRLWRTYMAVKTGQYISRNEAYLSPTTWQNALAMGLFGVSEVTTANLYEEGLSIKDWQAQEKRAFFNFEREMQRSFRAAAEGNTNEAQDYIDNAQFYLEGIPIERRNQVMADVVRSNRPLIERIPETFYTGKDVPDADRDAKLKAFQTYMKQIKGGK